MPPAAYFFWLVRSGNVQPLFLCAAKKKPLAVKRKRQRGISISPFAIPLKRPRRGLRPPSLDFPRGLVCAEIDSDLQNAMQMRIGQTGEVIEILCGEVGRTGASAPTSRLIVETPQISYVQYSTGANEATRTVLRALGNPIGRPPEGRSDDGRCNDTTQNGTTSFSGAKRYFASPAPFSSISFPARGKRYGPRSGGDGAPNHTAPSAQPECIAGVPFLIKKEG